MPEVPSDSTILHGTSVALDGRGLLILGPSGSGKSNLALGLIALGAELVSDDRTCLHRQGSRCVMTCPKSLSGLIEARGVGILHAQTRPNAQLHTVVDLSITEDQRLPPFREVEVLDVKFPLIHKVITPYFPAVLLHYLRYGRAE